MAPLDVHAGIDIGTNSFHLIVARPLPEGGFEVLTIEKEVVRLGQGAGEMKRLTPEAIDRGIAALGRMAAVAASYDAVVHAVATSAVREALNRDVFLQRARDEAGVAVEVISGFEEARLIHLGVLQALPVFDQRILVVDIGGGSTEFLLGQGRDIVAARSLKLGAIRLTDRFFADLDDRRYDPAETALRVERCRAHVRNALAATAHEYRSVGPEAGHELAIGSSGTATALAIMAAAARGDAVDQTNGLRFSRAELTALVDTIAAASPAGRMAIPGMDERRVDIILAGAVLMDTIFDSFAITDMTLSAYALREGLLFDRLSKRSLDSDDRLANLRHSNVERLAVSLDPDAAHARTAARLALRLFDQTADRHGLGSAERELLELAALVHNVGLFISHASHHKHSYYVVRHSEQLTGFSEAERELMALIARYHRRSHPDPSHPEFAALDDNDRRRVRVLAGLLRVAIGLDRAHTGVVDDVTVGSADGRLQIEVHAVNGAPVDLELFAATDRSALLAEALGVEVVVSSPASL